MIELVYVGRIATLVAVPPKNSPPIHSLPVSVQLIERRIYLIRGHRVMLDVDLADGFASKVENPTNGSWWIVQIHSAKARSDLLFINPTNGSWWILQIRPLLRLESAELEGDLNNPPTAVGRRCLKETTRSYDRSLTLRCAVSL